MPTRKTDAKGVVENPTWPLRVVEYGPDLAHIRYDSDSYVFVGERAADRARACVVSLHRQIADHFARASDADADLPAWDSHAVPHVDYEVDAAGRTRKIDTNLEPSSRLGRLLAKVKGYVMSPEEREEQRRSFAHGNASISNPKVTRAMVDKAADHYPSDEEIATELGVVYDSEDRYGAEERRGAFLAGFDWAYRTEPALSPEECERIARIIDCRREQLSPENLGYEYARDECVRLAAKLRKETHGRAAGYADALNDIANDVRATQQDISRDVVLALIYDRECGFSTTVMASGAMKAQRDDFVRALDEAGYWGAARFLKKLSEETCKVDFPSGAAERMSRRGDTDDGGTVDE